MTLAHPCLRWAFIGATLGLAWTSWAQGTDGATLATEAGAMDDGTIWIEVLKGGGLPAILAFLGFMAGRGGGVPIVVQLHPDDRKLVTRIAKRIAAEEAKDHDLSESEEP
jgi:hypothetical protein